MGLYIDETTDSARHNVAKKIVRISQAESKSKKRAFDTRSCELGLR